MLLGPVNVLAQSNAYGPGINSDATGRSFVWRPLPGYGPANPLSRVRSDAYGPGIGMESCRSVPKLIFAGSFPFFSMLQAIGDPS
jgi:hypothetical protein